MDLEKLLPFLIVEGRRWVLSQKTVHRPEARALTEEERSGLSPFFQETVLDLARVKIVRAIENPPFFSVLREAGLAHTLDFSNALGMAFLDTILVSQRYRLAESHWMSLMFHELVHVVQYQLLELAEFVERYVHGWVKNGFDYFAIPLERDAYELQRRYDESSGQVFSVAEEVHRRLFVQ